MPGDDYLKVLARLHEHLKPESYVEIGVAAGTSLALARRETRAVGIDPRPRIAQAITARAMLYPVTSDEFFQLYDLLDELGTPRLAMAFIDGLHCFDQVLKDFMHIERYADRQTVVLIHDCLPLMRRVATRVCSTAFWCGDVWKIIPCLVKHRPDLTVRVVPASPSGLGIVTGLDRNSVVLGDRFDQILREYQDMELGYAELDQDQLRQAVPNIVPNDWVHIDQALSQARQPEMS